ncbi:hypothetical protein D3C84_1261190 [compost metagenome]
MHGANVIGDLAAKRDANNRLARSQLTKGGRNSTEVRRHLAGHLAECLGSCVLEHAENLVHLKISLTGV